VLSSLDRRSNTIKLMTTEGVVKQPIQQPSPLETSAKWEEARRQQVPFIVNSSRISRSIASSVGWIVTLSFDASTTSIFFRRNAATGASCEK
jgi:hypothetical protein